MGLPRVHFLRLINTQNKANCIKKIRWVVVVLLRQRCIHCV